MTSLPNSAKPDSAKSKMMERLKAKAAPPGSKPAPEVKPAPAAEAPEAPEAPAVEAPDEDAELFDEKSPVGNSPAEKTEAVDNQDKKTKEKVNPWKLVEEHKSARATQEKEIADLRKLVPNAEARKAEMAEVESIKKRNQELEEHIKFVDFQQSREYKEKYEKPYEDQWKKSMRELKGISALSEDGSEGREIVPQDVLDIVNMSTAAARKAAIDRFGEFANDVMAQRDKIRGLFDARQEALDLARKEGVTRAESQTNEQQQRMAAMSQEVKGIYDKAVESFANKPAMKEYFQPIEGDEEANARLERGYALVDEAFSKNPMDPNLTPEQRNSIVKKHAAVRHRAAAFSRATHLLAKERALVASLRSKLAQFEKTVPNRGGSETAATPAATGGSKMQQMLGRLRAKGTVGPR